MEATWFPHLPPSVGGREQKVTREKTIKRKKNREWTGQIQDRPRGRTKTSERKPCAGLQFMSYYEVRLPDVF